MPKATERITPLGRLLLEAMRRKGDELGDRYTYRDLERDSGVHFTYAQKVATGERKPSPDIIGAWAKALRPYFSEDEALVLAGYLPRDRVGLFSWLARLTTEQFEEVERVLRRHWLQGKPTKPDSEEEDAQHLDKDQSDT